MPHKINISGTIGWDTTESSVRSELLAAKGGPISVEVSSPGGSVYQGISIYNQIREYEGEKETRIMGLAASMGSYIALATPKVTVADNAVYMIHNAWSIALGDHNEMRKAADELESLSKILSKAYVKKTGKSKSEIQSMMDSETFVYGEDIADMGFADSVIESENDDDKDYSLAFAKLQIKDRDEKMAQFDQKDDLMKAAALLEPVAQKQTPTPKGAVKMTPEEIQALQDKLAATEAKLAESEAAKVEPAVEEEPVVEAKVGVDKALAILQAANYPQNVKDIAASVIKGDASESDLNIMVAAFDMVTEQLSSKEAKAESDELDPTPGAQAPQKSESGVPEAAAFVKDFMNQSKGGNK